MGPGERRNYHGLRRNPYEDIISQLFKIPAMLFTGTAHCLSSPIPVSLAAERYLSASGITLGHPCRRIYCPARVHFLASVIMSYAALGLDDEWDWP
jgi:hypothetical protein